MGAFGVQRDMERNDVGMRGQFVERYVTIGGTQLLGRFARRVRAEYPESPCGGIPFHERTDVADADDAERQTGGRCLADRAGECGRYPLEYPAGVAARSGDDLYPVGGAPWQVDVVGTYRCGGDHTDGGTGQQCRIAAGSCANQKRVRLLDLFGRDGLARQVGYVGVGFEYAADIRYFVVGYYFHRISMGVCVFSREAPGRVRSEWFQITNSISRNRKPRSFPSMVTVSRPSGPAPHIVPMTSPSSGRKKRDGFPRR